MVASALLAWWRAGPTRSTASRRAIHRSTRYAVVMGVVWAAVPLIWFPGSGYSQRIVVAIVSAGMMAAGTFVLSPLPRASMVYLALMLAGSLAALWRAADPVVLLLLSFAGVCAITALSVAIKANAALRAEFDAERQREMVLLLLRDFEENAAEALWEIDAHGRLTHGSERLAELLGTEARALIGAELSACLRRVCPAGAADVQAAFERGAPVRRLPLVLEGNRHWRLSAKPLMSPSEVTGFSRGWRGVIVDISAEVQAEERLRQMAHFDALTGLANRVTLNEALRDDLDAGAPGALLAMDLDNFKTINDTLGHSAGDALLVEVARRLQLSVPAHGLLARFGGDEFALLLRGRDAVDQALHLAQQLVAQFEAAFEVNGRHMAVGLSGGVAAMPEHGRAVDELIGNADLALYAAKEGGRGRAAIYLPQLGERSRRAAAIDHELAQAVQRGQVSLHWQPCVDARSGLVRSAEALLRWSHPELGAVSPAEFIPVAERTGLIVDLGTWVLREACRTAAERLPGLRIAVNISGVQLHDDRFVALVRNTLTEFGLPGSRLDLEITESVFIADVDAAIARLRRLQSLGVRIALDDFGTGYSSLAYLRRSGFDVLKIDRAFVAELPLQQDARAIVRAIVALAGSLRMETIAEGVESAEQLKLVGDLGCHEVQGFGIARPQPIDDFCRYLQARREVSAAVA
jgi:diguanylate cyclase (GGDEF)-like protein